MLHRLVLGWLLLCACLGAQAAARELTIGIEPYFTPRLLISSFQPMREALERTLGQPVVLLTAPDYRQFVRRIEAREFDLVIIGPHTARYAEQQAGYRATLIGRARLLSLLVVKRDGGVRQAADLSGQTVAMPDSLTATAMLGEEWLRKQNLRTALRYFDFHNAAAMAVLHGDAAAAFVNKTAFGHLPPEVRDSLRVLAETRSLPHMVVLLNGRYGAEERQRYADAVAGFVNSAEHGESFAGKLGFAGADAVREGDLDVVEPLVAELRRRLRTE